MSNSSTLRFASYPFTSVAALVLAAWIGGCASHDASAPADAAGSTSSDDVPTKHPIGSGIGGETSGTGGKGGGKATPCDENPVCSSLNALGVDTEDTTRLDQFGNPLPDTFNPLGGKRRALQAKSELFVGGARMEDVEAVGEALVLEFHADDEHETSPDNVIMRKLGDVEWTDAAVRAVAAADLDGDGAQEIVGVWRNEDGGELTLRVIANPDEGDDQSDTPLGEYDAEAVTLATGDFDGDGRDEIAVAVVFEAETQILFVQGDGDGYAVDAARTKTLPHANEGGRVRFALAAGNIDYDARSELVAVSNHVIDEDAGLADYFVWDDERADHAELAAGPVLFEDGARYSALTAGAAVVDADNDGIGEVVLAGIISYVPASGAIEYGVVALDDAKHGFEPIATTRFVGQGHQQSCSLDEPSCRELVSVNGLDVDGDLVPELQVEQYVLANLAARTGGEWPIRYDLSNLLGNVWVAGPVVVGDMDADGRDDIVGALPYTAMQTSILWRWSLTGPTATVSLEGLAFADPNALLVAANVDHDSSVIEFMPEESGLEFSEPIVLAALAAPPCAEGIGQNTDACTTSYGNAESLGTSEERSVEFSASLMVGTSVEDRTFTQSEFDLEITGTIAKSNEESYSYTIEKSLTYTTGAMEDAVVFTSVPYDRYVYTYVSSPDPDLVGEQVTVRVPREPVTLMVERSFYNRNAVDGAPKIDDEVFRHTAGDPMSYPTREDKDEVLDDFGGMETTPVSVDQGSGEKELGIEVGEEFGEGESMTLAAEFSIETTLGGYQVGVTLGREETSTFTVTGGSTTSYAGAVGALDAEHFAEHRYSFGLFTYVHELPDGRAFDVVNYWVE